MKGVIIAVIAANFLFFSCEKEGAYGEVIRGKVVHTSCATVVIQVLDPAYYSLGQSSWQQSPNTPVYNNVFYVKNQCLFSRNNVAVGTEINFQLTKNKDNDCAVCALWDNPPTVGQQIIVK